MLLKHKCSYLKIEEPKSDVLNDFLSHIFRVELGPELELQLGLFLHVLTQHFFVQLQPGGQALGVGILETEEPDLAKADCLDNLDNIWGKFNNTLPHL